MNTKSKNIRKNIYFVSVLIVSILIPVIYLYVNNMINKHKNIVLDTNHDIVLSHIIRSGEGIFAGSLSDNDDKIVIYKTHQKNEKDNAVYLYNYISDKYEKIDDKFIEDAINGSPSIFSHDFQKTIYSVSESLPEQQYDIPEDYAFIEDEKLKEKIDKENRDATENEDKLISVYNLKNDKYIIYNTKIKHRDCWDIESNLAWSPNDSKIAFVCNNDKKDTFDLYVYDILQEKTTKIETDAYTYYFDWSPDGSRIVFIYSDQKNVNHVGFYDVLSGKVIKNENQPITKEKASVLIKEATPAQSDITSDYDVSCEKYSCEQPIWSSDGNKIFFRRGESDKNWTYASIGSDMKLYDFHNFEIAIDGKDIGVDGYNYRDHSTNNNRIVFTQSIINHIDFHNSENIGQDIAIADLSKFVK